MTIIREINPKLEKELRRQAEIRRAANEILPELVRYYFYEPNNTDKMDGTRRYESAIYRQGQSLLGEKAFQGAMQRIRIKRKMTRASMQEAIRLADEMLSQRRVLKEREKHVEDNRIEPAKLLERILSDAAQKQEDAFLTNSLQMHKPFRHVDKGRGAAKGHGKPSGSVWAMDAEKLREKRADIIAVERKMMQSTESLIDESKKKKQSAKVTS